MTTYLVGVLVFTYMRFILVECLDTSDRKLKKIRMTPKVNTVCVIYNSIYLPLPIVLIHVVSGYL